MKMNFPYQLREGRSFDIHGKAVVIAELIDKLDLQEVSYYDKGKIQSLTRVAFNEPYPNGVETYQLYIAFMYLLLKHVYPRIDTGGNSWIRVSPALELLTGLYNRDENDRIYRSISKKAIEIRKHEDTKVMPIEVLGNTIFRLLMDMSEQYQIHKIPAVHLNIYSAKRMPKKDIRIPSDKKVISQMHETCIISENLKDILDLIPINTENQSDNKKYPEYITKLINKNKEKMEQYIQKIKDDPKYKGKPPKPSVFMVGDIETIRLLEPKQSIGDREPQVRHYAYAAAYMIVHPDSKLSKSDINHYSTFEYRFTETDFYKQSTKMLNEFINNLVLEGKKSRKAVTIYFHNMSKFDGILITEHLIHHRQNDFIIVPNKRNNTIYEISIYNKLKKKVKNSLRGKLLIVLRCSILLLPDSLNKLAKQMCPELGGKEDLDHTKVTLESLNNKESVSSYQSYLSQDVLLLARCMQVTQMFFWNAFYIDITTKRTLASLALGIFRENYYDDEKHAMYIPNQNADKFIRRGYYGGHSDVYIPYGENLYFYDANSLYPSRMVGLKFPAGKPVWHSDLSDKKLADLFGFVEALVISPKADRPFLPTRHPEEKGLYFPTGTMFGVYFTEELKYAESIGYTVLIICGGYLFDKMDSPFDKYVTDLYARRLKAKAAGDIVGSYVIKNLLNGLYGRLAISPESNITAMLDYEQTMRYLDSGGTMDNLEELGDIFLLNYIQNAYDHSGPWKPNVNTSPQMSAAITAYGRIYMHKFISRPDCHYTDTDSVVLSNPLPEEYVSETELGLFKLEHGGQIPVGVFKAPKCYTLSFGDENKKGSQDIVRYKGAPRGSVSTNLFLNNLDSITESKVLSYENNFKIDWKRFIIKSEMKHMSLDSISKKREKIFDKNDVWVATKPVVWTRKELSAQLAESTSAGTIINALLIDNKVLREQLQMQNNEIELAVEIDTTKRKSTSSRYLPKGINIHEIIEGIEEK